MWEENKIVELLEYFDLKKFDTLMLSAQFDNEDEMRIVINTFGAKAINNWDGDMLLKYAQIEVEKLYPI